MLRGSHRSTKAGSGKCSGSVADLALFSLIKKCFGGNISIKDHILHTSKVLFDVVWVNVNVCMGLENEGHAEWVYFWSR